VIGRIMIGSVAMILFGLALFALFLNALLSGGEAMLFGLLALFCGVPLVLAGIARISEQLRDRPATQIKQRIRQGRCYKCDYDLTGNVSGHCPECGARIERS